MQRVERRVVVTGIGLVTPLAIGTKESWQAAIAGKSGVGPITRFDAKELPSRIAGEVKNFDASQFMDKKEARRNALFIQFGLAATELALKDAGLPTDKPLGERTGVIVGSGMGGLGTLEEPPLAAVEKGHRRVSPFFIPSIIVNLVGGQISIRYGAAGVNFAPVSACATGNHALGESLRHLQHGDVDVMISGGAEATITLLGIAGFTSARALSERNDAPEKASRPFDKNRDGFVQGEGAGMFVFEKLEHAQNRGAKIYAEVLGTGNSDDHFHITAPDPDGSGGAYAMQAAIKDAGIRPDQLSYINAHGTSTPLNDKIETAAIKRVLGDHARRIPISSTKSMIGHLLGPAAAVEAIATILCLQHGIVHPPITLEPPAPDCDLDYVPNAARRHEINLGISNSFGFGGQNACVVIKRFEQN